MQKYPIVAIVGRPNVGKSTLFNRIVGFRQAIISREPGTTRDRVAGWVNFGDKNFLLVDTAGLLVDLYGFSEPEIESQAQSKIDEALGQADVVLFVVDAKRGIEASDLEVARKIRKSGKNIILVCNKADALKQEEFVTSFSSLGFSESIAVSAISGRRIGDLLELVCKKIQKSPQIKPEMTKKLAIVGRPNVGKSTLFNKLAEKEMAIVSSVAGTTRDAQKFQIEIKTASKVTCLEMIDTAGLRRRGRIEVGVEKFSALRSIEAIMRADIVLLLVDASDGLTRQDSHLAQLALENRKRLVIVLNKIDLLKNQTKEEIKNLTRFKFLKDVQMVAISAKSEQNLDLLKRIIVVDSSEGSDLTNR